MVIEALQSDKESFASFGHLIVDVKSKAFNAVIFSHTRRQGNSVAHNLTCHAKHVRGFLVWMENVPPHLLAVTLANLTRFS